MAEILSLMRQVKPLERLADKLRNYLAQEATNRQEWIEIQMGICLTLVEARDKFTADVKFHRWCDLSGLGADVINHQTRAAAIAMGRDSEALRKCLEATERRSLREIHRLEFSRFTSAGKPTAQSTSRRKQTANPKEVSARQAVRPLVQNNRSISRATLAKQLGVGSATIQRAELYERGRLDGLHEASSSSEELFDSPLKRQKRINPPYMKHFEPPTVEESGIPGPEDMAARHAHVEKYGKAQFYTKNAKDLLNDQAWIEDFIMSLGNVTSDRHPEPEKFFEIINRLLAHVRQPNGRGGEDIDFAKAGRKVLQDLDAKLDKGIARLTRMKILRQLQLSAAGHGC